MASAPDRLLERRRVAVRRVRLKRRVVDRDDFLHLRRGELGSDARHAGADDKQR